MRRSSRGLQPTREQRRSMAASRGEDYELDENDRYGYSDRAPQGTMRACSLAIHVKATLRIYARITVARVKAVCHPTPMKIYE
jgi:hypothetical protein